LNVGTVSQSFATGAVSGGNNSFLGGLVALNYAVTGFPTGSFRRPTPPAP